MRNGQFGKGKMSAKACAPPGSIGDLTAESSERPHGRVQDNQKSIRALLCLVVGTPRQQRLRKSLSCQQFCVAVVERANSLDKTSSCDWKMEYLFAKNKVFCKRCTPDMTEGHVPATQ